ncbi:MAG: hypothetical protein ABSH19_07655 [Opitutales bacterium]|jgi:hypothetical protein
MIRSSLKYLLAGLCALVLQAHPLLALSTAAKPAALPTLTDAEVLHYLTYAQRQDWAAAQKQITDGQGMIDSGNWLLQQVQPPNTPDLHVDDAHKAGQQQVDDGTALVTQGNKTLAMLRHTAQLACLNSQSIAAANTYQIVVPAAQWPDVIQHMSDQLMKSLWAGNYTQIFLSDVFAFEKNSYVAKPDLTDQVRNALLQSDGDHKTLIPDAGSSIKLLRVNGDLTIDYPGRASTSGSQSALIVGEVLFLSDSGYAYVSLRAVDLATGKIIHNELALLSVEPQLGKGLGLVAFEVPSARIPATAGNITTPAPDNGAVTITLQDPNGILSTFKNSTHPYVFRADTAGSNDTLENRLALLLAKSILLQKPTITVTDYDFLTLALPADNPGDRAVTPSNVNAVWMVSNLRDLESPSWALGLSARNTATNTEVNAGKLSVASVLKPLTPPTPDQLISAGYQLSSGTDQSVDGQGSEPEAVPSAGGGGSSSTVNSSVKHGS